MLRMQERMDTLARARRTKLTGLEQIVEYGTTGSVLSLQEQRRLTRAGHPFVSNIVRCADGYQMSVIAGGNAMSEPARAASGPYRAVEVQLPELDPGWTPWLDSESSRVYSWVPVEAVRRLISEHGGEA